MKFKQSEHDAFKACIMKSSMDYAHFTFNKKKGWLTIGWLTEGPSFNYHRKSEARFNQNGQFETVEQYFVKIDDHVTEHSQWNRVLRQFEAWLAMIT